MKKLEKLELERKKLAAKINAFAHQRKLLMTVKKKEKNKPPLKAIPRDFPIVLPIVKAKA
jgi:nucleoside-triphosphatase THEP1